MPRPPVATTAPVATMQADRPVPYTCPDCTTPLLDLACPGCRATYEAADGLPILLPSDPRFKTVRDIAAAYDAIYRGQPNVWHDQGRTPDFLAYFSALLDRLPGPRLLEIGCGEGLILGRLAKPEKFGIDLSLEALRRARLRGPAQLGVAVAERLPFPPANFDVIASVGVMEHFLDIDEATSEIVRVLKPGGHYVALTHINLTIGERLGQKVRDYAFPRPRPFELARWLRARRHAGARPEFVKQPIQNRYTSRTVKAYLQRHHLRVVEALHARRYPRPPLDPWVVAYVTEKGDGR